MSDTTITFLVLRRGRRRVRLSTTSRSRSSRSASRSRSGRPACSASTRHSPGFGDPTVLFIASLFVVSEALDASGVTAWAGQQLISRVGTSRTRLFVLMMLLVAVLTALISVNGAVAALLPVVVVMAIRLGRSPSQLLLPIAFGAHAGSLLTLTGTPVNVIVSQAADDAGVGRFGYFDFALVGVPLVAGTIVIVVLLGERLLPDRAARAIPRLQRPRADADRSVRARPSDRAPHPPLRCRRGRDPAALGLVGERVFPGMVTESGDLVVLAVQRKGEDPAERRCSRSATRCSCRGRGTRSRSTSTTRRSSSSTSRT